MSDKVLSIGYMYMNDIVKGNNELGIISFARNYKFRI